jgi:hypothetical protein
MNTKNRGAISRFARSNGLEVLRTERDIRFLQRRANVRLLRKLSTFAGFAAGLVAAFAAGAWAQSQGRVVWHWPESLEATHAAPKNHKVLFENDHVRLLEVSIQPGETENMHGHVWPSVFAYDAVQPKGSNRVLDAGTQTVTREFENADWYTPQCRIMGPQAPHQVTDSDTFPQHFYRIEFKKMDGASIESKSSY